MKTLVTGGTGFIGSNLVKQLLKKRWKVRLLTRKSISIKNVDCFVGDIMDKKAVEKAVKDVEVIFNLAGVLPFHLMPDKNYFDVNVQGVKNLLEACRGKQIKRFVHVSTVGIYGSSGSRIIDENSKLNLDSVYAKSKAKGEKLVTDYSKKYNLPFVIIRPTIGYGPFDTRPGFLNLFKIAQKGWLIPIGKGENFFHTVFVENLVDALILAAIKKEALGQDFIIGDNPCPRMLDILKKIARIESFKLPPFYLPILLVNLFAKFGDFLLMLGLKFPLYSTRVKFLTENRRYSIEKAKKILNFHPRVNLDEGLTRTYIWYKKNGYL